MLGGNGGGEARRTQPESQAGTVGKKVAARSRAAASGAITERIVRERRTRARRASSAGSTTLEKP